MNFKLFFLVQFEGVWEFWGGVLFSSERLAICFKILSVEDLRGIFNSLKS